MTGQFIYASVARLPDSDRGGWGVLERRDIDADAEQQAMPWLTTRLTSLPPVPPFPTPADLAGRSRRLRVHHTRDGRVLLVHAVEAGPDASGRPGNVVNHVVLLDADRAGRVVELWNSAQWLTPYGPEEVAAATLPADLEPGPLTRERTLDWLSSTRAGTSLGWLLDTAGGAHRRPRRGRALDRGDHPLVCPGHSPAPRVVDGGGPAVDRLGDQGQPRSDLRSTRTVLD
jgi:hypothetical protein